MRSKGAYAILREYDKERSKKKVSSGTNKDRAAEGSTPSGFGLKQDEKFIFLDDRDTLHLVIGLLIKDESDMGTSVDSLKQLK